VVYSLCELTTVEGAAMRRLLGALIVAAVATSVVVVGARAESRADIRTERRPDAGGETSKHATIAEPRLSLFAGVVKPFGATIRAVASPDAAIMFNTRCGDVWPVLAVAGGWVKVRTGSGVGWIGGSRVVVSSAPVQVDCKDARFLYPMGYVSTVVPAGCLSLQSRPSADATRLSCVANDHRYVVLDGPFDPGTGDDWFKVTSPSTGTGWTLAAHLFPT
jgi:hypothetical protein